MINLVWGGIVVGTAYGLMALSISFLFRITKVVNFAHGELFTLGAFLAYACRQQWGIPWLPTVLIVVCGCAVMGLVIDRLAVRPVWRRIGRGSHSTLLTTFGVALLLQTAFGEIWGSFDLQAPNLTSNDLIRVGSFSVTPQELILVLFGVVVVVVFEVLSKGASFFKVAEATSERPSTTELMGINTSLITSITWAISGAVAGLCGMLYAPQSVLNSYAGFSILIVAFAAMIVGGLGKPRGAMLAGYLVGVYQSVLGTWIPGGYLLAATFAAVIAVLVFRPEGVFARSQSVRA